MMHRYPVNLSTMQEDFRKIGLLPEHELTEDVELQELDNPQNPRDVSSPDPSTLGGNVDDSESAINAKARHSTGQQPRPKITPDEKDDHDDPMQAGGNVSGGKKKAGKYNSAPRMRGEDREVEEGHEEGPDASHGYSQYKILAKEPGMERASDKGKKPDRAEGNAEVSSHAGMKKNSGRSAKKMESTALSRAADLIGEVEALVRGARTDEETDELGRGFHLLGENAALLADRLAEIGDVFEVEHVVDAMEHLSKSAIEALDILEMKVSFRGDKKKAIKNGEYMPEEGEDDVTEDLKRVFQAMTLDLMDAIESYDVVLEEIAESYHGEDCDDDDHDDKDEKKMSAKEKMAAMRAKMGKEKTSSSH